MTQPMTAVENFYPRFLEALWPTAGANIEVYTVLDAARDERVMWRVDAYADQKACLYEGTLTHELISAAPHLLHLFRDDRFCKRLFEEAWGQSWGVFVVADTSFTSLRRHFRKFLVVRGPTGKRMAFRWYDPRILRVYLPTCNREELQMVFGPIKSFLVEGRNAGTAHQFSFDGIRLIETMLQLSD